MLLESGQHVVSPLCWDCLAPGTWQTTIANELGFLCVSPEFFANLSARAFVVRTRVAESIWDNYGRTDDHIQWTSWFFRSPSDALALGSIAARALSLGMGRRGRDKKVVRARIAVLGRGAGSLNGRLFVNSDQVVVALKTLRNVSVDFADFQNASFEQQVQFMRTHDLVVSPTGGQLSSLVFMPSCGAVLVLYSVTNYIPTYVRLAQDSGLIAGRLYLSDRDPVVEADKTIAASMRIDSINESKKKLSEEEIKSVYTYISHQSEAVEPPLLDVLNAVEEILEERSRCISKKTKE